MTGSLVGVLALGMMALGLTLIPRRRLPVATGSVLAVLCAAGMIILSEFWSLALGGALPGPAAPDIDLAFTAVWLLALTPLVQRPESDPPGLRLVLDLLIAAAFMGFAMDAAAAVVCPPGLEAGAGLEETTRVALDKPQALLALLLLSGAFLGGAVLRSGLAPGMCFPWGYAPLFAALLLLFTPAYPLLRGLYLDRWYGIPGVAVWLGALALIYGVRRASVTVTLAGTLTGLALPLSLSLLAWTPTS